MSDCFFSRASSVVENNWRYFFLVFVVVFVAYFGWKLDPSRSIRKDAADYMRGAYFIANHGVFSASSDRSNPEPYVRRSVGYPLFLAGCMKVIPGFAKDDFDWLFPVYGTSPQGSQPVLYLKYIQALLLFCTALMTAWLVMEFTGRRTWAYLSLWFIAFHPFLERAANKFYVGAFGSFLITAFCFVVYLALKHKRAWLLVLAGMLLGYLTLTYAQWKYIGCVSVFAIVFYIVLKREKRRSLLCGTVLMVVAWVAIFHPWELRNQRLFGLKGLSAGGGVVLDIRSRYNLMPASAFASAFAYWSRSDFLKDMLFENVDRDKYKILLRDEPGQPYRMGKGRWKMLKDRDGLAAADAALKKEGLLRIAQHPFRHLLTTIPIGYRSMMGHTFSVFNLVFYYYFLWAVFGAFKRKDWLLSALLASPLALFGFNAFVTHGVARYNEVATSLLFVGAVVGFSMRRQKKAS